MSYFVFNTGVTKTSNFRTDKCKVKMVVPGSSYELNLLAQEKSTFQASQSSRFASPALGKRTDRKGTQSLQYTLGFCFSLATQPLIKSDHTFLILTAKLKCSGNLPRPVVLTLPKALTL